ncbi:MAG: hypothetical protein ACLFRP_09370 [Puniceicoccaceae bacterium]
MPEDGNPPPGALSGRTCALRWFRAPPVLLAAVLLLGGCAGYRTGGLPDPTPASVFLRPVQNEAYISGMAAIFQNELRRAVMGSPYLRLADRADDADMTAYVRLTDFRESPVAFLESDSGQAISSRIALSAVLTLENPETGEVILADEALTGNMAVYSDPETAFTDPLDQSKPALARDLAARAVLTMELSRGGL